MVVTGTSDGHFVTGHQSRGTGKQIWKYHTSSTNCGHRRFIDGDKVYVGSQEGVFYCIDLKTGSKDQWGHGRGTLYFRRRGNCRIVVVFWMRRWLPLCFKTWRGKLQIAANRQKVCFLGPGNSVFQVRDRYKKLKQYLSQNGYTVLDKEKLLAFYKQTALHAGHCFCNNFSSAIMVTFLLFLQNSPMGYDVVNEYNCYWGGNGEDESVSLHSYCN